MPVPRSPVVRRRSPALSMSHRDTRRPHPRTTLLNGDSRSREAALCTSSTRLRQARPDQPALGRATARGWTPPYRSGTEVEQRGTRLSARQRGATARFPEPQDRLRAAAHFGAAAVSSPSSPSSRLRLEPASAQPLLRSVADTNKRDLSSQFPQLTTATVRPASWAMVVGPRRYRRPSKACCPLGKRLGS